MKLSDFEKLYSDMQKKHGLPAFKDMNYDFDIGKIKRDSGNLLRDIRRMMVEKIVYYIKLVEIMVNPSQASPIMLMLLKEINSEDKKTIDLILDSFVELEIEAHKLDIKSNENEEAKLVNKVYSVWNGKREQVLSLIKMLERNFAKKPQVSNKKGRDYFN